jgi:hypothetical protein
MNIEKNRGESQASVEAKVDVIKADWSKAGVVSRGKTYCDK